MFSYMYVCMYMYHLHAWCPQQSEKGIVYLELGLGIVVSHCMGTIPLLEAESWCVSLVSFELSDPLVGFLGRITCEHPLFLLQHWRSKPGSQIC